MWMSAAKRLQLIAMFYVVTYVLTTLAAFGVIMLLAREGFESEEIADLAGLNQRSPLYAGVMAVCLFSHGRYSAAGGLLCQAVRLAGARGFWADLTLLWPCLP
jgi:hypothetical protein